MSGLKATPGAWELTDSETMIYALNDESIPVNRFSAQLDPGWENRMQRISHEEIKANAHLMRSARDLYEELDGRALNTLLGMIEDSADAEMWAAAQGFMERRDALLRKARGES